MWKKNRKRVLALGLTFSIIIGMAGCGKEAADEGGNQSGYSGI